MGLWWEKPRATSTTETTAEPYRAGATSPGKSRPCALRSSRFSITALCARQSCIQVKGTADISYYCNIMYWGHHDLLCSTVTGAMPANNDLYSYKLRCTINGNLGRLDDHRSNAGRTGRLNNNAVEGPTKQFFFVRISRDVVSKYAQPASRETLAHPIVPRCVGA